MDPRAAPQPQDQTYGPELYLHVEFRLSFGKKQHPPKTHQVTCRSRGPRERAPAFPRQVPAPNTNYLAAVHEFNQRQAQLRQLQHAHYVNNHPNRHHQMQEYYQSVHQPAPPPAPAHLQVPMIREPQRPTRADARPSHERGRSAPPPIGENPWDVNIAQSQPQPRDAAVSPQSLLVAETRRNVHAAPPSQFRLGDGQPWSTWSMPADFIPGNESGAATPKQSADRSSTPYVTNPTMVSIFSPDPATPRTRKTRELRDLSAAMMTIDNGFESQWWYQGARDHVPPKEPATPTPEKAEPLVESPLRRRSTEPMSAVSPGPLQRWPTAPTSAFSPSSPELLPTGIVSPMSEAAFSPAMAPAFLQRSMSTRSEELWFD
ncbi:hypothetical protein N0V88_006152 [Collariella sp. IMI 366227]|nr:hypothetical protein N0V88_006152 [Collariella sp. IMI 366227]